MYCEETENYFLAMAQEVGQTEQLENVLTYVRSQL